MASGRPPIPKVSAPPRVPTRPGLSAPPARRLTPADYAYPGPDEDEPTHPGDPTTDTKGATLARLYANLTPEERRRLVLLADAWFRCDANGRALVEGVANELAIRR